MNNLIYTSLITLITLLLGDFLYTKKKRPYNISFFEKGCIKNSFDVGYEYLPGKKCRYKRIIKNSVEYDNEFKTNNAGFVSNYDYFFEKSGKKRAVVLGYSMAEGNYIQENWPSAATRLSSNKIEFYNFARAGYFNLNLFALYEKNVKKYEYDILMLPKIGATKKQFMIFEQRDDGIYDGLFVNIPQNQKNYNQSFKGALSKMYEHFDQEKGFSFEKSFFIIKKNLGIAKSKIKKITSNGHEIGYEGELIVIDKLRDYPDEFNKTYGRRNVLIYLHMVSDALRRGAKVLFYQDPIKGVSPTKARKDQTHKLYSWLKEKLPHSFYYLDGNDIFKRKKIFDTKDYFFKYDGHWNQAGASLFAEGALSKVKAINVGN